MTGIIFCKNKDIAQIKMEEMIEKYKNHGIQPIEIKKNGYYNAVFKNKDYWLSVIATDRSRGRACNVALIDKDIDKDIINQVIMPCLKLYPYQAYNYF